VRAYLAHFWSHWSGPGFEPDPAELDRLGEFFSDVELRLLDGVGHFTPVEAPDAFAGAIAERLT
jgi:pimeloyl-ACP methyl ester carboxylesterase